jgi:hypothetical protein
MGKNTPDRQDFIIGNLRVELNDVETEVEDLSELEEAEIEAV